MPSDGKDGKDGKEVRGPKAFPCRVGLARKDADSSIQNGANEVFLIDPEMFNTRRALADHIKSQFHKVEKKDNVNVPDRCFWGTDYDAERLKVSWDPPNTYSSSVWGPGASMSETEITDTNVSLILEALALCPPNAAALSVLIAHKIPKDLQSY